MFNYHSKKDIVDFRYSIIAFKNAKQSLIEKAINAFYCGGLSYKKHKALAELSKLPKRQIITGDRYTSKIYNTNSKFKLDQFIEKS